MRVSHAALAIASLAVSAVWARELARPEAAPSPDLPKRANGSTYVTSSACIACHPGEHASFRATFHRTMTQAATNQTVLAPLARDAEGRPTVDGRRVVMTTGSHRHQAYWTETGRPGDIGIAPFVWLVKEKRLVPREDAFLHPPDDPLPRVRWGSSCIACHAVAGEPHHDEARDAFDLRAAELGIACEACHGPGLEHVERHRDPIARYVQHARSSRGERDPTIVQPKAIGKEASVAVCGQCHSYAFPRDVDAFWSTGYALAFRAGDALERSRTLLVPGSNAAAIDRPEDALFWADGTVRVGGRETNGLVLSKCFTNGDLRCTSCHAMHAGDPSGQIDPKKAGDAGCTSCHATTREHSHHREGSEGHACVSCHMPKTSYALLSAVRSHRIDVPSAESTKTSGRPNACNLCHLDKSLAWTDARLGEWFGSAHHAYEDDIAQGAREALSGDAAVRVIVADALGGGPAPVAFRAQLLGVLAKDPYAAVRAVAARGPIAEGGPIDGALLRSLLAARDDRKVTIAE